MGMTDIVMSRVQNSRVLDISKGTDFRWIIVWFNLTANGLGILTPVVTLTFYALGAHLRGKNSLNPTLAFTSLAIITLVIAPANSLLALFPQFGNLYGCATRIQKYLLEPSRVDSRLSVTDTSIAVNLQNVMLRPAVTAAVCLQDVTVQLAPGSLNVICGAVGTGKTTLVRAILGEITPDSGSIAVSTKRVGYCAQKPWLINASIKTIICGPVGEERVDEEWYKTVICACGLQDDIDQRSGGDLEPVGSRGATLSGGQRQRVALARAVFARPEIIVLDDVLSALDSKTEARVAEALLGPNGIFRTQKTTVILVTHATQHLPLADHILVLDDSKIREQGTWDDLRSSDGGFVSTLQVKESDSSDAEEAKKDKTSTAAVPASASKNDISDLTRQAGDLAVYCKTSSSNLSVNSQLSLCSILLELRLHKSTAYVSRR